MAENENKQESQRNMNLPKYILSFSPSLEIVSYRQVGTMHLKHIMQTDFSKHALTLTIFHLQHVSYLVSLNYHSLYYYIILVK